MSLSIHHIVFAALMHDIGKVIQRTGEEDVQKYVGKCRQDKSTKRLTYKHPMWTAAWLDKYQLPLPEDNWRAIIEIAGSHHCKDSWKMHNYDKYLGFVMRADHMASSWDRETPEENAGDPHKYYKTPLYSVFSRLYGAAEDTDVPAYPLGRMSRENMIPRKIERGDLRPDYKELFGQFEDEYKAMHGHYRKLAEGNPAFEEDYFPQYIDAVESLLRKYFWCVPANTLEKHPLSSLYHHLRNTATIAAALYAADTAEKSGEVPFMIVAGDLNGIQAYLYDLNQENSSKASKLLRSRSFQIQAIMEMAAHRVVRELGLSRLSVFSSLGGKWFILAPDTPANRTRLEALKTEMNRDIYERFLGTVSINLNWDTAVDTDNLKKDLFLETMAKAVDNLEAEKGRRFHSALTSEGKWDSKRFIVNSEDIYHDQICQFCRRRKADPKATEDYLKYEDPEEEEARVCGACQKEIRLGRNLVKAEAYSIYYSEREEPAAYISFAGMHMRKADQIEIDDPAPGRYYFSIRGLRDIPQIPSQPVATHVPADAQGRVQTFEEIAQLSQGIKANAVLKGDVDNLGYLISRSWIKGPDGQPVCSITDYTTLSGMLNHFFSSIVPAIQEESYPDSIYTVYSGGDDFCFIGAYDKVIDFTRQLRKEFASFCAGNPNLHFSAAITIIHPKQPIKFSIISTEEKLKAAKNRSGKNNLYLYETIAHWDEVEDLMGLSGHFDEWLETEEMKLQFLYRLLGYHQMYLESKKPECDVRNYLYESLINYDIKRNIEKYDKERKLKNPEIVRILKNMTGLSEGNTMKNLRLPLCHTIYKQRSN